MSQNDEKSARRTIDGIRRMIYPSRRVTNRNRGRGQNNSDRSGVPFMQFMHSGKIFDYIQGTSHFWETQVFEYIFWNFDELGKNFFWGN